MDKFSLDWIMTPLSSRRQFLELIFGAAYFSNWSAVLANVKSSSYFYWLDLQKGIVVLPVADTDRVACGQPGSLMKLVAAAAIAEEKLPIAFKKIDCRGLIVVNGEKLICRQAHGVLSLTEALGQSCNVFFAQASHYLSLPVFLHYAKSFGLAEALPSKTNQTDFAQGSLEYLLGLAKGLEVNALEMLRLMIIIAKRGQRILPLRLPNGQAVWAGREGQLERTLSTNSDTDIKLGAHTWNVLQEGMRIACRQGTAKNLDPKNKLHLAVKTGTTLHGSTFRSWLIGYFPYEAPRYVFCLRANVGTSYDEAVPLAHDILFEKNWL